MGIPIGCSTEVDARSRPNGGEGAMAAPAGKVPITALTTTAYTAKRANKRKTDTEKRESKRESDNRQNKCRVNIGQAYPRWRELCDSIGLKLDSELADLLLDR